jgi:hypothetical protein
MLCCMLSTEPLKDTVTKTCCVFLCDFGKDESVMSRSDGYNRSSSEMLRVKNLMAHFYQLLNINRALKSAYIIAPITCLRNRTVDIRNAGLLSVHHNSQ